MATVKKRRWLSGGAEKEAWVVYYADQNKKRHIKTFKTKREAEAWRIEAGHQIARGTHTPAAASITVAEAGKRWLDQCKIDGLEAATLLQYRQHLDIHIVPFLGATRLAQLTTTSVGDFRNKLVAQGRSRIMAGKVIVSLGAILDNAMTDNLVAQNVVRSQATGRPSALAVFSSAMPGVSKSVSTYRRRTSSKPFCGPLRPEKTRQGPPPGVRW